MRFNFKIKGFVLAAGLGTRLKPITDNIPKPLVTLGDKTLIEYGLNLFKKNRIKEIGLNIHHKREQLEKFAKENGLIPFYEKEILGTGGYLTNLRKFFDAYMVTINCDTVFFNDEGILDRLIKSHIENKNLITLVLKKLKGEKATPFQVEGQSIKSIGKGGDYFFTGLQMLSPEIIPLIEYSIVDVYKKLIPTKKIGFVEFRGTWFDCGTLSGLINANKYIFGSGNSVVYPGGDVSKNITLKNSVIYNAKVEGYGEIINSIIYENAYLNLKGEQIENKIIV
ncbi:hypothetical protein TTHT_1523 [Thermotomaculum hydrothermale]|uniref:Nucleotidyl transferase domain-containing protein n=1 Tax=Thermotomaculum hydrothermale TaxID=981385 RepID=A0A7R6PRJ2_9BACT|nr:sugar phosphate nucleotidyltransferase [Thermotomaculum hydrothermale]BBB33026.1 hypothetical protein TTHT_1523 [Thermotomaculum hydrothermale]